MGQEQILRDKNGTKIGSVTEHEGQLIGRDKLGRRVGSYDPSSNVTRDERNRRVGDGDQLSDRINRD